MGDTMGLMAGSNFTDKTVKKAVRDDPMARARNLDELRIFCRELAEQVRTESLSRWSMQQALRMQFPEYPEADVTREMQEALRQALGDEGGL
ncbi:MAG: hypothetical protein NTX25_22835 [Proteobacteria bacterium]|nr:hypothetical protein [Pseudomonadota bacterium]